MSDPTKKNIIINKSFLSGTDNYNAPNNHNLNKKSKKNTRHLSDELIKPNKLKKMLLDKINAKRKADLYSSTSSSSNNMSGGGSNNIHNNDILDVSKETKMFSSEFKKSLEFLDNYVNQKKTDNHKSKTLKKQNAGSLNNDILKSLHNNSNNSNVLFPPNTNNQSIQTQAYIHQPVQQTQSIQHAQIVKPKQVSSNIPQFSSSVPVSVPVSAQAPMFQKIHLQVPQKIQPSSHSHHNLAPPSVPKINLAIGKTTNENLIYTELPPELQNFSPPVYNVSPSLPSSPSYSTTSLDSLPYLSSITPEISPFETIEAIDSREMNKLSNIESNNSEEIKNLNKTSLSTTDKTFSPIKLTDDAPYGCLKGGNKPTFRTYNKTIKNGARLSDNDDSEKVYSERQIKLKELQDKHGKKAFLNDSKNNTHDNINESNDDYRDDDDRDDDDNDNANHKGNKHHLKKTKVRRHLRTTITKKFKLGKQSGNIVGVLIKNNDTRKNIQKEHGLLKNKQLPDIKKYLIEKNMIKIGSTAPPGVIRNIYEASILAGEVDNVGKGVVLHNFLEDKKTW
jgi:hypothetical protein